MLTPRSAVIENAMSGKEKRIFLIDDHPAVRQGLRPLLEQEDYVVCGEAGTIAETRERIGPSAPDLVLLDISLGEENGIDCIGELCSRGIAVLVYSMHEDNNTVQRAMAAGANGYVSKREPPDVLLAAIVTVLAGMKTVSPRLSPLEHA
jgi:DNA-binding NarL/FixJ family response regulator